MKALNQKKPAVHRSVGLSHRHAHICTHTCICICTHVHIHIQDTHTHTRVRTHTHTRTHMHTYVHTHARARAHTHTHTYTHTHHINTQNTHASTHTLINTHTHTCKRATSFIHVKETLLKTFKEHSLQTRKKNKKNTTHSQLTPSSMCLYLGNTPYLPKLFMRLLITAWALKRWGECRNAHPWARAGTPRSTHMREWGVSGAGAPVLGLHAAHT